MNPTTESRMWLEIEVDNSTVHESMIMGHRGIVLELAKRFRCSHDHYEDLISIGDVELCGCVDQFREKVPDCCFSTFAYRRVHSAIVNDLRTENGRNSYEGRIDARVNNHWTELSDELGRTPTIEEFTFIFGETEAKAYYTQHEHIPLEEVSSYGEKSPIGPSVLSVPEKDGLGVDIGRLPASTKAVLTALSEGATPSEVSLEWDIPREELSVDVERLQAIF